LRFTPLCLLLLFGCTRQRSSDSPDAALVIAATGRGKTAIGIALPEGWTAATSADSTERLTAGPLGQRILFVQRLGKVSLPSADTLEKELTSALPPTLYLKTESSITESDFAAVKFRVEAAKEAGQAAGFVAARRLAGTVYLCSSAPGATSNEVEQSQKACQQMELGP
jgi:hypothetical protein